MNFPFGNNFDFGNDFSEMFGEFFADSVFKNFGFLNDRHFPSFNDEEFFQQFQHSFPDSMFTFGFPFEQDSIHRFEFGHQWGGIINRKKYIN